MKPVAIDWLGEFALCLRWEARIDADINAAVHECARWIRAAALPEVLELVPAYASLALRLQPERLLDDPALAAHLPQRILECLDAGDATGNPPAPRLHGIPVCYGPAMGADFLGLCERTQLHPDDLIAAHCAPVYQVAMIGFAPGFPYLLGLDPRLAAPRHAQPRTVVPGGSVGIAGTQTGIYPQPSPGGWQLLGRTPWRMFDAAAEPPCRLRAGDRVRFIAIDAAEFARIDADGSIG